MTAPRRRVEANQSNLARQQSVRHEAERALLGAMIRDRSLVDDVLLILKSLDAVAFAEHRMIADAIFALHEAGRAVDLVTLAEHLTAAGNYEAAGGAEILADLWDRGVTGHWREYATIVHEHHLLDSLRVAGANIERRGADPEGPVADMIAESESEIATVAERGITAEASAVTLQTALAEELVAIDARRGGTAANAIPTGFTDLDEIITGLHATELIVIGARPSVGKTAFALSIAANIASKGAAVLFCSLEQNKAEIASRLLSNVSRVDSQRMRKNRLHRQDFTALEEAQSVMRSWRMIIDDAPSQTVGRIAAVARREQRRHKIEVVFIDYLQLIQPDNPRDQRYQQIGVITRRLKCLARELNVPVVALSQLNRDSEDSKRPRLSDLRESGNIEQDSDTVILMHRVAEATGPVKTIEIDVAKQRNGPLDMVALSYIGANFRFESRAIL